MMKKEDWEKQYQRFVIARNERNQEEIAKIIELVQPHFENPSFDDSTWLENSLQDPNMNWFVAITASRVPVLSEEFFNPLMRAGIAEINPDFNRAFIEPCVVHFGPRRVNEYLLDVLETGPPFEQAGAVNAMYWAQIPLVFNMKGIKMSLVGMGDSDSEFSIEHATEESRTKYTELLDIWQQKHLLFLEHFVKSKSVEVQQSIIPSLNLNAENYPESHKPLVKEAIQIAQSHPDDYIRHRLGVQLGTVKTLKTLPYRKKPQKNNKPSLRDRIRAKIKK